MKTWLQSEYNAGGGVSKYNVFPSFYWRLNLHYKQVNSKKKNSFVAFMFKKNILLSLSNEMSANELKLSLPPHQQVPVCLII